MSTGFGDRLARGANKASWGPLDVSKEKWESIWEPADPEPEVVESQPEKPAARVLVGIK